MIKLIRMAALLAVVLSAISVPPETINAEEKIAVEAPVSLTAYFTDDGMPVAGTSLRLYRVASIDEDGTYVPDEPFARYDVVKHTLEAGSWSSIATTLEGLAGRDGIEPDITGVTSENGIVDFDSSLEGDGLQQGMYLMLGDIIEQGEYRYIPSASIISLPSRDEVKDEWMYDVHVNVKYEKESALIKETARKTIKIWNDDGNAANFRPDHVEVVLIRDDRTVVESQVLSADNNWAYVWGDLDASHKWTISELDVSRYIGSVVREGEIVSVVNQFGGGDDPVNVDPPVESTEQTSEDEPRTQPQESPDETRATGSVERPGDNGSGSVLPKTGQLWWPVLILAIIGVSLILAGVSEKRRRR